jgi:hypothetical protein
MDEVIKDDRFKHIVNDAKFKILPKNERKFKVDKRFKVNIYKFLCFKKLLIFQLKKLKFQEYVS